MLTPGTKAPDFTLNDQNGNPVSLSDFAGKKVVLYFYAKDNTLGCTRQACGFAQMYNDISAYNAVIIGISRDSVQSHLKFAGKYDLPFTLLSDPELNVLQAYGVWQQKKSYGKTTMGVVRSTYIIDENGYIETVMEKVGAMTNPYEVLEALKAE
ncbi:MAG: thioredoxin-dependent thiol peroxidase [Clostridia bacterium]|nr:thioredoxin-dependent thiol peroxidase [Clostridia bacterium]MBR4955603.1 thioredoxin-dependent thiol peroxidase [Clostridia bacterium]MBR5903679.1 thioredoxin-dependent thiol peroxidase [Clostridia bacterium]